MNGIFWYKSGFKIYRNEEGNVVLQRLGSNDVDGPVLSTIVFDTSEWCSLVATVSKLGETAQTWREATDLHEGKIVDLIMSKRAYNLMYLTPTETLLATAIGEIEKLGADKRLSDAQFLITKARALLASYIDERIKE